jgi:hypothetical protein
MTRTLTLQVVVGHPPEFIVDKWQESLESNILPIFPPDK